ncbi:MAG: hypothetical protein ACON4X_09815 [Polaribacter sp.]|jgi:hypothetical protein
MRKYIPLLFTSFLLFDCSTVPNTGRKRINLVSDSQILPASFSQYQGFLEKNKLSTNREMTNQVKDVGQRISAAVDRFMRVNNMVAEADAYTSGNLILLKIKL